MMATNGYGYFRYDELVPVNQDGSVSIENTAAGAGLSSIIAYLGSEDFKLGELKVFKTILGDALGGNIASNLIIGAVEFLFIDDEHISIDGAIHGLEVAAYGGFGAAGLAVLFEQMLLKYGVASALTFGGAIGAPLAAGIAASIVYAGSAYLRDLVIESVVESLFSLDTPITVDFYMLGYHELDLPPASGLFFPDGLNSAVADPYGDAVRNFIVQAQGEIIDGGTIEIETSLIDFQLDKSYTLHNASDYFATMLERSSAADELSFLTAGDGKNLNNHVYKGASDHYFFFEDNDVSIDIPVIINGVETIITVNDVYFNGAKVMGAETIIDTQPDVIFGDYGHTSLTGSGEEDLILGYGTNYIDAGSGNDNIEGGDGLNTLDGGSGNDNIEGGIYSDSILGGSGNDTLIGGEGDNTLNGGASSRSVNEVERVRHSITSSAANDNATFSLNLLAA